MDLRRYVVPLGAFVALVVLGTTLEVLGRVNGRSPVGAAIGVDESSGCMAGVEPVAPEDVSDLVKVEDNEIDRKPRRFRPDPSELEEVQVPGEIVLKLARSVGRKAIVTDAGQLKTGNPILDAELARLGIQDAEPAFLNPATRNGRDHLGLDNHFIVSTSMPVAVVLEALEQFDDVEWAQPELRLQAAAPSDPFFSLQWHMAQMGVEQAWQRSEGEGVVVAVVDTGVTAFTDGYLTLLPGADFIDDDEDAADTDGHGSHVAGTVAQRTNNGVGTVGMAPQALILPVRVLGPDGGTSQQVADGIRYAVDNGAKVINLSLGGPGFSSIMCDAVDYAFNNDVVVVAATGNDGFTDSIGTPANCENAIAVGATDMNGDLAFYSNHGPGIDIVAPGGDVTADLDGDGFGDGVLQETIGSDGSAGFFFFQGTSMATPHVAGAAALIFGAGATDASVVVDALLNTADDLGAAGYDETFGHGLLDPIEAIDVAVAPAPPPPLKLKKLKSRVTSPRRAKLKWKTTVAADTAVEGSDGSFYSDNDFVTAHSVVVKGKRGSSVDYTVTSIDREGRTVSKTHTVVFEVNP